MFGNSLVGTAIGLALVFFLVALLCSAVVEWWANISKKRAKYLLRGLRDLLEGPGSAPPQVTALSPGTISSDIRTERELYLGALASGNASKPTGLQQGLPPSQITAWVDEVLGHPLVQPFKQSRSSKEQSRNPSYLPSRTVAASVVDILVPGSPGAKTFDQISAAVESMPDALPLKRALRGLLGTAEGDVARFVTSLEHWFDDAMDRVSGSYKRWSKRWLIVVGLVIAALFQLDTIQIGTSLYSDAPLRDAVTASATNGTLCPQGQDLSKTRDCISHELTTLNVTSGLPVGWGSDVMRPTDDVPSWGVKALGWALTAFAASFGAPFWFQALSKLGSLRNTGNPPARTGGTSG